MSVEGTLQHLNLPCIDWKEDCPPCWERLDRLDWNSGIAFESYGTRLGIRTNDPSVLENIARLLPPGWKPISTPIVEGLYSLKVADLSQNKNIRRYHLLYQGVGQIARTMDLDEALAMLLSDLHSHVAAQAREMLFVHAGVAAWNGRAIVIPGRSFSGKTSLVAALIRAGATYYSDEYAVFDTLGQVHPYAKPLSMRDESGQTQPPCPVESIGGHAGTEPLPVGMIVAVQYEAGASWRPRPMSPGQAMMTLLDNTVKVRERPQATMETLQKVAMCASAVKSKRGEATPVASWLLSQS